jgi:hypothetical protein
MVVAQSVLERYEAGGYEGRNQFAARSFLNVRLGPSLASRMHMQPRYCARACVHMLVVRFGLGERFTGRPSSATS